MIETQSKGRKEEIEGGYNCKTALNTRSIANNSSKSGFLPQTENVYKIMEVRGYYNEKE
ncbi:MAG: hypothetical protein RSC36_06585 [Ruthenibacterium sp.]